MTDDAAAQCLPDSRADALPPIGKLEVNSLHLSGPGKCMTQQSLKGDQLRAGVTGIHAPPRGMARAIISEPTPDDQPQLYSPAAQRSLCCCIVQWPRNQPHSLSDPIKFVGNSSGKKQRVIVQEIN
ncbi:hypothetical protein BDN70DRAFT_938848 [Pholiota conissans]|uniref:Uncharacterized protein n=1 Tax=Pholiota conissans TaxID=109636 RepID=A0A9P6CLU1_9AGAR|nr:hypothetical protein BDN70DRAFT_938848 [Pholiota conissans]